MRPSLLKLLIGGLIFLAFTYLMAGDQDPVRVKLLYQKAETLYNDPVITDEKDSLALSTYYQLIELLEHNRQNDSILWDCYFKAATYEQTLGNYEKAIPILLKNLSLKESLKSIPGELAFLPNLYAANSYYIMNRFDSARYFYGKAEKIANDFHVTDGLERLYNGFGILNFETGNYSQSKNNFEKAVSIANLHANPSPALLVNFRSNLASALRKLHEYDQALTIYKELLGLNINADELLQNIAATYQGKSDFTSAIAYLRKVKSPNQNTFNSFGFSYLRLGNYDSAALYLNKARQLSEKSAIKIKTFDNALTAEYEGELEYAQRNWEKAINKYQEAINQFIFSFNENSIYKNPKDYTGCFAVTELFETLLAKATAFEKLYQANADVKHLEASLETLRSLYSLSDYAEKTYESDEARIFLNQKKYASHHIPINVCLELFRKTKNQSYLKEAFYFDERNKASVLSIGISEKQLKKIGNIPEALLMEETNCKELINSLTLKASTTTDKNSLEDLQKKLRDQQLKLESIDNKMNDYPTYSRLKFSDNTITIEELQNKVIPSDGVILSFHWGDSSLLTWIISTNKFEYVETRVSDTLKSNITKLYSSLTQVDQYSDRNNREVINFLYTSLISPIEAKINGFEKLMIIPDDELNFVPFGMLLNNEDERALEKFTISYNYSCTLLRLSDSSSTEKVLTSFGLAPYASGTSSPSLLDLPLLPASEEEISVFKGKKLVGIQATKDSFLAYASRYPIIHLATHAFANDADPVKSFIAFYPVANDSTNKGRLYSPEIYNLDLNKTQLVILSACETGSGQLIKGEGILSLARAFYYAGCPNMITSQWKADDQATAYITKRVHHYLENGKGNAEALQKSKLDYLKDPSIDSRLKTPAYWAHLRFTGQFDNNSRSSIPWLWLLIPMAIIITIYTIKKSGW